MASLLISIEAYQNIICNKSNYFCNCTNKKIIKEITVTGSPSQAAGL